MLRKIQLIVVIALCVIGMGCHNSDNKSVATVEKTTPGIAFLKDCKKWDEWSSGALQALDPRRKDSARNLCFSTYYGGSIPYEIIFVYKGDVEHRNKIGDDSINKDFTHGCDSLFRDFDCYAFVHPMVNPDTLQDIHGDKNVYPASVKVYKRVRDDQWLFVGQDSVHSLPELSDLRFRTIYGL